MTSFRSWDLDGGRERRWWMEMGRKRVYGRFGGRECYDGGWDWKLWRSMRRLWRCGSLLLMLVWGELKLSRGDDDVKLQWGLNLNLHHQGCLHLVEPRHHDHQRRFAQVNLRHRRVRRQQNRWLS